MKTKTMITSAAAATLLLAAPLAALAHDRDGSWGHPGNGWKHGHYKQGYVYAPARVQPYYYPVARPVFVPAPVVAVPVPAPVVAVPAPVPYPSGPVGNVSIGFRLFF